MYFIAMMLKYYNVSMHCVVYIVYNITTIWIHNVRVFVEIQVSMSYVFLIPTNFFLSTYVMW